MSTRALRRLREQKKLKKEAETVEEGEDDEEEEGGEEEEQPRGNTAFLAMMDDDSDDEDDSDSDSDSDEDDSDEDDNDNDDDDDVEGVSNEGKFEGDNHALQMSPRQKKEEEPEKTTRTAGSQRKGAKKKEETEDFDAILADFESKERKDPKSKSSFSECSRIHKLLMIDDMDLDDLDVEYVMRTMLTGASSNASGYTARGAAQQHKKFLFGPTTEGWVRPPHFVGGGIGMIKEGEENETYSPPWPYNVASEEKSSSAAASKSIHNDVWFSFQYSNTYMKDSEDYERIQESGDVNALALFVAHHPYVTRALLQLAIVLYHVRRNQEGLDLLRRSLWVYECSFLNSFKPTTQNLNKYNIFMDCDKEENSPYFMALFRLMQVSHMQGCIRTSLAVSRYLLSLDPRRDPMGVLLTMDYFALATLDKRNNQFIVNLVESNQIKLYHRADDAGGDETCFEGALTIMPNWAFSYALALLRLSEEDDEDGSIAKKADDALQWALEQFPFVLEQLLKRNDVDLVGRGFDMDWPSVTGHFRLESDALRNSSSPYTNVTAIHVKRQIVAARGLIGEVFVQRNYKLWGIESIIKWLYRNCVTVVQKKNESTCAAAAAPPVSCCETLIRYLKCDPADYADSFRTLPDDANPLDPALLPPAIAMDPNRRRFLRRNQQQNQNQQGPLLPGMLGNVDYREQYEAIDPDLPMMEVYWRSLLPWNRVEGIPPARR